MNKTLIPLLATFSKVEWKSFGKFLQINHSLDSKIYRVFLLLKSRWDAIGDFTNIDLIRKEHFSEITTNGFIKLISKLFQECELFMIFQQVSQNGISKNLLLNDIYNSRGLFDLADRKAAKVELQIGKLKSYSIEKYKTKSKILHQQCYSDNPIKYEKGSSMQQDLFDSYLTEIKLQSLVYLCEAENWGRITHENFSVKIEILEEVLEIIPDNDLSNLLKKLRKILVELDVVSFLEVRKELFDGLFEAPSELHKIVTMYLINSCIKLWRKGTYVDADANAKLIEYGLSSGVLTSSGKIPYTRFLNLLSTLGKVKTYDWNTAFIERWIDQVETKSPASTHSFANALNAFNFGKYELIEPLLRGIEFEKHTEKIRALALEMLALYIYRKDNYYVLRIFTSNYKRTLKRSKEKISSTTVKAYLNLVKVVELLIQKDFRRLTIRLEKYQPIAYRTWVIEEVGKRD